MVEMGKYDNHLLEDYTEEEFKQMDTFIDHDRDMTFSYAAVKQLEGEISGTNRVTGEIYESAQFLYILVAACLFSNYPRETRLQYVKRFLRRGFHIRKFHCPPPIMSGVRTPTRQFSSCVLIECGDSLDSSTPPPARLLNTFPSVPGSASTPGVFVRWVARFAVVKRSTCIRLHSVLQTFPDSGEILLLRAVCAAVRQRYSTRCGIWKWKACWC